MSELDESGPRGRLVLVTAARAATRAALASAVADRLARAVVVDGAALEQAVTTGAAAGWDEPPTSEQLRARLLRWSAALAVAETYQLEGFEAVVVEDALGDRLEDFLDLVEPEPVHVVVVRDGADPATPRWGLWVDGAEPADVTADDVIARLGDALVMTSAADPREPTGD
ncbi:hypothetical protein LJR027_001377 [Terrabacter sp. LjRoot27]|uniref:hypothetical protein n=1 Tax=Terrabacter sp. LjRoot27 TaxID=3342306 RepID=UPI003ECD620B